MPYAVFILRGGAWVEHCQFGGPISARQERDYLVNMLGLVAKVFKRGRP